MPGFFELRPGTYFGTVPWLHSSGLRDNLSVNRRTSDMVVEAAALLFLETFIIY